MDWRQQSLIFKACPQDCRSLFLNISFTPRCCQHSLQRVGRQEIATPRLFFRMSRIIFLIAFCDLNNHVYVLGSTFYHKLYIYIYYQRFSRIVSEQKQDGGMRLAGTRLQVLALIRGRSAISAINLSTVTFLTAELSTYHLFSTTIL